MTLVDELGTLGRYVLPTDVAVIEVAALPADVRSKLDAADSDCAVTRPLTRSRTTVVDAQTARLLANFRTPSTIVDAILNYCRAAGADPVATLNDAFTVVHDLVLDGFLVAEQSDRAVPIGQTFHEGERVGAFTVVELRHLVVDTEVYLGRAPDGDRVAIKVVRGTPHAWILGTLAREVHLLRRLGSQGCARLLDCGTVDGRPFLVTAWCDGVDVLSAADLARGLEPARAHAALLALGAAVLETYAALHDRGVLHGDVHPGNAIVGPDGDVTLVDLGFAVDLLTVDGPAAPASRGGVDLFLEPEAARARRVGAVDPPASAAGEQYAVAALLYRALTGSYTHAFSLDPVEMLQQVLEEDPTPFAQAGAVGMPHVEAVVRRSLEREPAARWRSLGEFRDAYVAAAAADLARPAPHPRRATARPDGHGLSSTSHRLLDDVLERIAAPGPLYRTGMPAPTASLMNGAAGLAYALLRTAVARDDPQLLAQADLWAVRAHRSVHEGSAFYADDLDITPQLFGTNSYCHHACGGHVVRTLVGFARGDGAAGSAAVDDVVATANGPCDKLDITFGRAGLLVGCASVLAALPDWVDDGPVRKVGALLRDDLWDAVRGGRPLTDGQDRAGLGAAHGWAGYLTALLRWSQASSTAPPAAVDERLDQLAALALPAGRGSRWPVDTAHRTARSGLEASWCNGAAGYVELWTHAYRRYRDERFLRLASAAAWTAYESPADVGGDLCCGFAGRAFALLTLHRLTGDDEWLARARALANLATERVLQGSLRPDSLYKGRVGVAVLVAELEAGITGETPLLDAHAASAG